MRNTKFRRLLEIGEPCALKGARTVRGGAVRKGLADDTTCGDTWQVGLRKSQYLARRLLYSLSKLGNGRLKETESPGVAARRTRGTPP